MQNSSFSAFMGRGERGIIFMNLLHYFLNLRGKGGRRYLN